MKLPTEDSANYDFPRTADFLSVVRDLGAVASRQDALAAAWMHQGFSGVSQGDQLGLTQALHCFDQAIAVRESLLTSDTPWSAYNLAGAWINRGDVLDRLGGEAQLDAAIASYDCALALLSGLVGRDDERHRERRAIAHLNRGTTLLHRAKNSDVNESVCAFEAVLAVLEDWDTEKRTDGAHRESAQLIAASARANQADALARLKSWEPARHAALAAMSAVASRETVDSAAARVGLKARLALCACNAGQLDRGEQRKGSSPDQRLAEALDAAEDGIALAHRGSDDWLLERLRLELVRFCAQGYARRQPHLLTDFLRENLSEAHPVAAAARATAIHRLVNAGIKSIDEPSLGRTLATLRELTETATRVPA